MRARLLRVNGISLIAALATLAACGSDSKSDKLPTSYVGEVQRSNFYLGISLPKGKNVLAYFCDGKSVGVWFKGERSDNEVDLTAKEGARLHASLSKTSATGTVSVEGRKLAFKLDPAVGEAGVYRKETTRRGKKQLTGWVLLSDGTKKGVTTTTQEKLAAEEGDPPPPDSDPAPNQQATSTSPQPLPTGLKHTYLGNYPSDANTEWHENVQGIADDDKAFWFITTENKLFKIPVGFDLNRRIPNTPVWPTVQSTGVLVRWLEQTDAIRAYDHFGDLDYHDGYLFIPITGKDVKPAIAVFRANDLKYLNRQVLSDQSSAGWLAIDPPGQLLYTSNSSLGYRTGSPPANPMFRYNLNLSSLKSTDKLNLTLRDTIPRYTGGLIERMQGGVFSPRGHLYLVNGFYDKDYQPEGVGLYEGTGLLTRSCNGGPCSFNYEWHPGSEAQEPEGITWWPRSTSTAPVSPGIAGQLHVLMVDNDVFTDDDVYLKHYRVE